MIVIHKPTIDDYAAVRALVAQVHALHHAARSDVYAADAHFLPEHYAALLSDANAFPIAAYDGDKLVGFASAFMKPANPNPAMLPHRIAYIDDICVHSDCRVMKQSALQRSAARTRLCSPFGPLTKAQCGSIKALA